MNSLNEKMKHHLVSKISVSAETPRTKKAIIGTITYKNSI